MNGFTLSWEAPEETGGSNNLRYRVKQVAPETKELAVVDTNQYRVVVPDQGYSIGDTLTFRVRA